MRAGMKGREQLPPWRRWLAMEKVSHLVENAFMIAWEYLEATGELGEAEGTAGELLDIHAMIRTGERRRILIANTAIDTYKRRRLRREGRGQSDKAGAA
jgi:hypothetical protein